jgi:hypothetical protein
MRYRRSIAVASYFVLCIVWVYWLLDRQVGFGNPTVDFVGLVLLAVAHVVVGLVIARWWALALPLLPIVLAFPVGYPSANRGEPLPIWMSLLFVTPVAIGLIASGVVVAQLALRARRWS